MADWTREFDDPAPLPRGRQRVTLKDAANYIQKLPKAEQHIEKWQAAVEALLLVVELNGPTMMVRIGVLRALNRNVERVFNPDRKDKQWGKRRLKRGPMTTVWVYVDTSKEVGDVDHLKVFATPELADEWFKENDPEGVVFGYEVIEE